MDDDELIRAVDGIEDPPFPHGILAESQKVVRNRVMAQVVDIGGQPLALVEEPLGYGLVNYGEVLRGVGSKSEAVPGHGALPPKAEPLSHVFAGETLIAHE